jgi:hypothetical protein
MASGAVSFVGIQRDFEITQENLMASMMNMAFAMTGTDPANEQEFRNAITGVSGTAMDMAEATRLLSVTVGQATAEGRDQLVAAFNDSALGQAIAESIPSLTTAISGMQAQVDALRAAVAQWRNDNRSP